MHIRNHQRQFCVFIVSVKWIEGCAMCLPGDIPQDDLADGKQEGDPLKMAHIGSTPVTSQRVRAQYSKMALQTRGKCCQAVCRKMRRSTKF